MKLIVGLGNIGPEYQETRHNFGFLVLDQIAEKKDLTFKESNKFKGEWASEPHKEHGKIFYLKPHTYMNLSGQAVQALAYFYKIDPQDILVVYDDMDLELGSVRMARGGGAGGHKGINSIMMALGTDQIPRLKLGIGKTKHPDHATSDYVLGRFTDEEIKEVDDVINHSIKAIQAYLRQGLDMAMNRFNRTKHNKAQS